MDARGIEQKQVFREKNLSLNSVHGRTLFNRLFQKAYGMLTERFSVSATVDR